MRNLLVPQSAIEFNDRKWFQADTSQLYQDTRNWNLKHFSSGEEKKMAIKLQRRYHFLHIFVILLPCIHSASFAFAYLIRGYYHLWCILFCKLKMEDDTEEMGYYHLLLLLLWCILFCTAFTAATLAVFAALLATATTLFTPPSTFAIL